MLSHVCLRLGQRSHESSLVTFPSVFSEMTCANKEQGATSVAWPSPPPWFSFDSSSVLPKGNSAQIHLFLVCFVGKGKRERKESLRPKKGEKKDN